MKMYKFCLLLILCLFCNSIYSQSYDSKYSIEFRFGQSGANYSYYEENSLLKIENGSADLKIEFKLKDLTTAKTNNVTFKGSASGKIVNDEFKLSGSGAIYTYEKEVNDDVINFDISLVGKCKLEKEVNIVSGTFSISREEEEAMGGSFTGESIYNVKLEIIRGSYQIMRYNTSMYVEGKNYEDFNSGDIIKTGENTRILIHYPDRSVFRVKSNSIVQCVGDNLKIQVGELFFEIGKQGYEFQVITSSSSLGVLGTTFIVSVDNAGNTEVYLISGKIYLQDNMGSKVILEEGEHISVSISAGLSTVNKINSKEVEDAFDADDPPALNKTEDVSNVNSGNIAGKYNLVANNYNGMLEIFDDMKSGRIFFDIGNKWEEISNLTYNQSTGELFFTRPSSSNPNFQKYRGILSMNKITGVFTDVNYGSQEFPWEAVIK